MTENQKEIEYWNGPAGLRWVRNQERMDDTLAPLDGPLIELARPVAPERVLDVGCGCGATTLALADRAPGIEVVGLDISEPMLARARERAAGRPGVSFVAADAAHARFDAPFDLVFSRFGVMFFVDPVAGFANLRALAAPGARLAFVCWRAQDLNLWASIPLQAVAPLAPPQPPDPLLPTAWSLDDGDRLRRILDEAGWQHATIEPLDLTLRITRGGGLDAAVEAVTQIGSASRIYAVLDEAGRAEARARLAEVLSPYLDAGGLSMAGAVWLVTARR